VGENYLTAYRAIAAAGVLPVFPFEFRRIITIPQTVEDHGNRRFSNMGILHGYVYPFREVDNSGLDG
jgi:hypothetical protein